MRRKRNGFGLILFIMILIINGGCTAKTEPKAEETTPAGTPASTVSTPAMSADLVETSHSNASEIQKATYHSKTLDQDMRMNGLNTVADQLIESGKIVPLIIVAYYCSSSIG